MDTFIKQKTYKTMKSIGILLDEMITEAKAIQTNVDDATNRRCSQLMTIKNLLQFMSSLVLPLMLGIFTVVITFHQQKVAQEQRLEDRQEAEQQRFEDRQAAQQLRDLEKNLSDQRHQDDILNMYIKTMATFMKDTDGVLESNTVIRTLARAETINTLPQLDSQRVIRLFRFLFEGGQLSHSKEHLGLDLSTVEFRHIDFRYAAINHQHFDHLSLIGTHYLNVSFKDLEMTHVSFQASHFDHTDFSQTTLIDVNFSSTILNHMHHMPSFEQEDFRWVTTKLSKVNFSSSLFHHVDFLYAELEQINYSFSALFDLNFIGAKLSNVDFSFATLKNIDFSSAELRDVNFSSAQLQNVTFIFAKLYMVDFFSNAPNNFYLSNINFESAQLDQVNFASVKFYQVLFPLSQQIQVNYSSTTLGSAIFAKSKLINMSFSRSRCLDADFRAAILSNVVFHSANLKETSFLASHLIEIDFSDANLQYVDFQETQIDERHLQTALSVHGALRSDGTMLRDRNLIQNGEAKCDQPVDHDWKLQQGEVIVERFNHDQNDCRFVLKSIETGAIMWQHIYLTNSSSLYKNSISRVILTGSFSQTVSIQLSGINRHNQIIVTKSSNSKDRTIEFEWSQGIHILEVLLYFPGMIESNDYNKSWCDDLYLYIDFGPTTIEPFRIEPLISPRARWTQTGGVTVIGRDKLNGSHDQLDYPHGLFIDIDQTLLVADYRQHRIVMKKVNRPGSTVMIQGNGLSNQHDQLYQPVDVIVQRGTGNIVVCEEGNRRVSRWSDKGAEIIIDEIDCVGLSMDDQSYLYVSDDTRHEVRRYRLGDTNGTIVAGGNGRGNGNHQLNKPSYIFVDRDGAVYVSDEKNHRIMKWIKEAKTGIVVAGGNGEGGRLEQLASPLGLSVDALGNVYVADCKNHRIMRWKKGAKIGTLIIDGHTQGDREMQFSSPYGISFDRHGHLYVADYDHHRIRKFTMIV